MRRTLFILIGMPVLLALGLLAAPGLTVSALQKEMAAGTPVTVVDLRSPSAYAQEHVPGAINIPAAVCPLKKLPPLGQVVVYGDGLGGGNVQTAAAALAAKPGIQVQILDGGFAGWQNAQAPTTRRTGFKRESPNYISYTQLKAEQAEGIVLYDLRKPVSGTAPALTDLSTEFPGAKRARSLAEASQNAAGASSLVVLIDSGDGTAEQQARLLRAAGTHNYVILAGGETILARHGKSGLQLNAAGVSINHHAAPGAAN